MKMMMIMIVIIMVMALVKEGLRKFTNINI